MHTINRLACIMICTTYILQAMEKQDSEWEIIEKRTPGIIQHDPSHTTETFADGKIIDRSRNGHLYDETTIFPDGTVNYLHQDKNSSWQGYAETFITWHAKPTSLKQDDPNFIRLDDIPVLQQFAQELPAATIVGYHIQNDYSDEEKIRPTKTKTIIFPNNIRIDEYESKNRRIFASYTGTSLLRTDQESEKYMQTTRVTDQVHESIVTNGSWNNTPCYFSLKEIKHMQEKHK